MTLRSALFGLGLLACNDSVKLGRLGGSDPTQAGDAGAAAAAQAVSAVATTRSCASFVEVSAIEGSPIDYAAPVVHQPELHFLAVYQSTLRSTMDHPTGSVRVTVERPGHQILHLYAYEPTDWTLEIAADTILDRVEVYGEHAQRVLGLPSNVAGTHQVDENAPRVPPLDPSCAYHEGCDAEGYAQSLSHAYGYPASSFGGAYAADAFRLKRDPEGCATRGDALRCTLLWSASDMYLATLLLPENVLTVGSRLPLKSPIHSMGKRGEDLFVCHRSGSNGTVTRVDARNGAVENSAAPCEAVTANGDGIWAFGPTQRLTRYADWAAVGASAGVESSFGAHASRIAVYESSLWAAWHSTGLVERTSLDGSAQASVPLEGYNDWVYGLAVVPDGRLLVTTRDELGTLLTFDRATGQRYESFAQEPSVEGGQYEAIVCEPR